MAYETIYLRPQRRLGRIYLKHDPHGRMMLLIPEGVDPRSARLFLDGLRAPLFAPQLRSKGETDLLLEQLARKYQPMLGLETLPEIKLQAMDGFWGKCRFEEGRILLNETCTSLTDGIIEALLVHELCHLRVHDHEPAFWRLMTELMPDWAYQEGRLRRMKP